MPKFKTIETTIPAKYKWLAIDKNGGIFVYINKPNIHVLWGDMWEDGSYSYMKIGKGPKPKDFTKTLKRI